MTKPPSEADPLAAERPSEWALRVAESMPRRRLQVDRDTDVAMLLDEVQRATALECIAEANEYSNPVLPRVFEADIRRRFNLPIPDPRAAGERKGP